MFFFFFPLIRHEPRGSLWKSRSQVQWVKYNSEIQQIWATVTFIFQKRYLHVQVYSKGKITLRTINNCIVLYLSYNWKISFIYIIPTTVGGRIWSNVTTYKLTCHKKIPISDYGNFNNVLKVHFHKIYHRLAALATFKNLNPIAMKEELFLPKIFYTIIYKQNMLLGPMYYLACGCLHVLF